MIRIVVAGALAAVVLAGCAYDRRDDRYAGGPGPGYNDGCGGSEVAGTVVGGVAGGVIGNQFGHGSGRTAATIGGALLGAIAGNAIARDACEDQRADAYYYNQSYYDAFENPRYGQRYEWRNRYNDHYGYVTPRRAFRDGRGECREFTQEVYVDDYHSQIVTGVACRQSDGRWRIVG